MEVQFQAVRPIRFELRFNTLHADRVARQINEIRAADSGAAYHILECEGHVERSAGFDGADGFGAVRLVVKGLDAHEAERNARRYLSRVEGQQFTAEDAR
jgi:hypothetical protein